MNEKIILKGSAIVAGISGVIILTGVIYPIASYESSTRLDTGTYLSPLAEVKGSSIDELDYTRASNWFVGGVPREEFTIPKISFYTISVPKLGVKDATVSIGGEDLSKSLIQYPRTALPGKRGTAVVFGHSILPQFFDPEDYMSIFSTLPTLTEGDEVEINYDGVGYRYRVIEKFEVLPTNLSVLDQDPSGEYLSLITCTPPGHPLKPKRLVVRAKLIPPGNYAFTGN